MEYSVWPRVKEFARQEGGLFLEGFLLFCQFPHNGIQPLFIYDLGLQQGQFVGVL